MRIINAGYEILIPISEGGIEEIQRIEKAARVCYKSEGNITDDGESAKKILRTLIKRGHEAMIEHSSITIKFICDRGVSHQLVRHRIASWAQESTRYRNYAGDEMCFIRPWFWSDDDPNYNIWLESIKFAEDQYNKLIENGAKPEEARSILPNSTKTEVVMTCNYRELRNFFKLRVERHAHPQMREITTPLLLELSKKIPVVFDDIAESLKYDMNEFYENYYKVIQKVTLEEPSFNIPVEPRVLCTPGGEWVKSESV